MGIGILPDTRRQPTPPLSMGDFIPGNSAKCLIFRNVLIEMPGKSELLALYLFIEHNHSSNDVLCHNKIGTGINTV